MRLREIAKQQFDNWVFPPNQVIESDFAEYQKKEYKKWESRAKTMGFRFPIFEDINHFKQTLEQGKVVEVTDQFAQQVDHLVLVQTLDQLRNMVSGYVRPRDVDSIVSGIKNNDPIPLPIILKGTKGMHIMAGNTRLNVAHLLGVPAKALVVDVSE